MGAHSILTVADAARILRVSPDVVYRLLADRTLPGVRVGRSWRIPEESLSQWLAAQSAPPAASAAPSESTTVPAGPGAPTRPRDRSPARCRRGRIACQTRGRRGVCGGDRAKTPAG